MDLPNVPRAVLGLTWREHIGGRWAVSAIGFAVTAPVAFLALFDHVHYVVAVLVVGLLRRIGIVR